MPVCRLLALCLMLGLAACRSLERAPALPEQSSVIRDQLVINSDFGIPKQHRLIDELAAQRLELSERLQLPPTEEPIHIYLFSSPASFQEFIERHHPEFPQRRAFFVETDTRLAVYAHWGDRVAEDLRHEVAHGYLHAAVPHLPLWLDEGLAEYFEVPRGYHGLNMPHVDMLRERIQMQSWRPNVRRLEALGATNDMTQLDYAESWAWVYFLLETDPARREILHNHLQTLRKAGVAPPLSLAMRQLYPDPDAALLEFIGTLRRDTIAEKTGG